MDTQSLVRSLHFVFWLPRSPDLSVPDFFLWDYLEDEVNAARVGSIAELKIRIKEEIPNITSQVILFIMHSIRDCRANILLTKHIFRALFPTINDGNINPNYLLN